MSAPQKYPPEVRDRAIRLVDVLQATLRDQCPGDHRYVRHRDGVLPCARRAA
jgi:hypothetical protein